MMLKRETMTEMSSRQVNPLPNIKSQPWIPYPQGVVRQLARLPLLVYRLGLGNLLKPAYIMVLTTRGRKSGKQHHTPVEYRRHGRKIYLISAWGERTDWFQNALAFPWVTIQVGGKIYAAQASRVEDSAEALRALNLFRRIAPARYDTVLSRLIASQVDASTLPDHSGRFTILRLDTTDENPVLSGLPANLVWLWPLGLSALVGAAVIFGVTKFRRSGG
jgi:deazaflavin-dependent oxidoreductase (nitroreductase family)